MTIPKDDHSLLSGTCDYTTLLAQRDFADIVKV